LRRSGKGHGTGEAYRPFVTRFGPDAKLKTVESDLEERTSDKRALRRIEIPVREGLGSCGMRLYDKTSIGGSPVF
jgi:hypothetical protein